jgi:hypothetical protein
MKKFTSIFNGIRLTLAICCLSSSAGAQIFAYIGSGTTYNDYYEYPAPYGHYYWYSRHQFFLSPAEIAAAGVAPGGGINSVGFDVFSPNYLSGMANFGVTIYTTTSTDPLLSGMISSGQVATSTLLATYVPPTGWNDHAVSSFTWNGTDGIVIETCHHSAPYTENAATYWEQSLPGSSIKSRAYWQDNVYSCQPTGFSSTVTSTTRPNIRLSWANPCTSTPGANSVMTPTFLVCPNSTVALGLASNYTVSGLTFQWYYSTSSAVGPFTAIATGTNSTLSPTVTANSWYQVQIGCPQASSVMAAVGAVSVAPITQNTVPYLENFELIGINDRLPNCSWSSSGPMTTTRTYTAAASGNRAPHAGTSYAAFTNSTGTHYYWTNQIWLDPGVTYSAAVWYQTDLTGAGNWSNLDILYGATQTPTGLTSVAKINGPVISPVYKLLSNTFTVANAGYYNFAVKATAQSGAAQYLSWDDLSITIPCYAPYNPVNVQISTTSTVVCAGSNVVLNASGATNYQWWNTQTGPTTNDVPQSTTFYSVIGTNTLTGCTGTAGVAVQVKPSPNVFATAFPGIGCAGKPIQLLANGAVSYMWNNNMTGSVVTVTVSSNSSFSVIGTGTNGCAGMGVANVVVNQNPVVSINASSSNVCKGDPLVLTATGANNYNWTSTGSSNAFQGAQITVYPMNSTIYSVAGTATNNCTGLASANISVDPCTGLADLSSKGGFNFYPNPANSDFVIESGSNIDRVDVIDVTGRVVMSLKGESSVLVLHVAELANGVYHVKVTGKDASTSVKMVKE